MFWSAEPKAAAEPLAAPARQGAGFKRWLDGLVITDSVGQPCILVVPAVPSVPKGANVEVDDFWSTRQPGPYLLALLVGGRGAIHL